MHAAEICVCRPGWIKDKTGERLTRTDGGPAEDRREWAAERPDKRRRCLKMIKKSMPWSMDFKNNPFSDFRG